MIQRKQTGFRGGLRPDSTETTWTTADGTHMHALRPRDTPSAACLAVRRSRLAAILARQPLSGTLRTSTCRDSLGLRTNDKAAKAFDQIMGLLWNYVLPPKLAVELYRALTDIPGVTVNAHATDIAGLPGIAFELSNILRTRHLTANPPLTYLSGLRADGGGQHEHHPWREPYNSPASSA